MKKVISIFSIFLFLVFSGNTMTTLAQTKQYSQGFYTMKDLGLSENISYTVTNHEPFVEGLFLVIDSDRKIQQLIRIPGNSTGIPLIPLKSDYRFIIYNNVRLTFS